MRTQSPFHFGATALASGLFGLAVMGMGTFLGGCASSSYSVQQTASRQPQATVRLEEVADWSFEAAHPISIDSPTMAQLLRGVMISDLQSDLSNLPVDGSKPMRVFSDEDVQYLAPLLAQALSQAKPEYVVAFRLSSSAGSGSEPTTGSLYAQNDMLYLTITHHEGALARSESSMFGKGRPARLVTFAMESIGRVEQAPPSIVQGQQGIKSLAIDYNQLAKAQPAAPAVAAAPAQPVAAAPMAAAPHSTAASASPVVVATAVEDYHRKRALAGKEPMSEAPPSPSMSPAQQDDQLAKTKLELEEARQALAKKDAKITALRRDLDSMRSQLESIDKELRAVKTKQAQTKRERRGTAELAIR